MSHIIIYFGIGELQIPVFIDIGLSYYGTSFGITPFRSILGKGSLKVALVYFVLQVITKKWHLQFYGQSTNMPFYIFMFTIAIYQASCRVLSLLSIILTDMLGDGKFGEAD